MPARADLYNEEFDTLVNQKGIECDYQAAIVCQCITHDSNQPVFSCPYCGGSGYRYLPPVPTRVVVTSFASQTESEMIGLRESGTAYATPPSDIIMGFHDRLTFPKFKCKYSERLWVQPGQKITNKTYRNIKEVIMLMIDNQAFEEEIDFKVSDDRYHIEFTKPLEELLGDDFEYDRINISILYYTTPAYLVVDLLHELRATYTVRNTPSEKFVELPKQYKLRREDFIYNVSDSLSQQLEQENSEDSSIKENETEDTSGGLFD